jgi:hypothetical protein
MGEILNAQDADKNIDILCRWRIGSFAHRSCRAAIGIWIKGAIDDIADLIVNLVEGRTEGNYGSSILTIIYFVESKLISAASFFAVFIRACGVECKVNGFELTTTVMRFDSHSCR